MNCVMTRFGFFQVVPLIGTLFLLACGQSVEPTPAGDSEVDVATSAPLVIYSGRGAVLVDPLIEQFKQYLCVSIS